MRVAYLDAIAFVFPVGLAIGRFGCTLAHDHPGMVTNFPLAISLESESARIYIRGVYDAAGLAPPTGAATMGFHDLGFYECLFLTLVLIPAFAYWDRRRRSPGFYLIAFAALYLPVRFALDFLRVSDVRYIHLTPAQWSAVLILATLPLAALSRRKLRFVLGGAVILATAWACWGGRGSCLAAGYRRASRSVLLRTASSSHFGRNELVQRSSNGVANSIRILRDAFVGALTIAYGVGGVIRAQTPGDLGAFSALMVLPDGALSPTARDFAGGQPDRTELSLRYGGWRYDINDGVHDNFGATLTERVSRSTTVSLTGAYLTLSGDGSEWLSGGVAARSILWSGALPRASAPGVSAHVALSAMVGGAHFLGEGHASALAAHSSLDVGGGVPVGRGSRVNLSAFAGLGAGRIASDDDDTRGGIRPTVGTAVAWTFPHGFTIDIGAQRVILQQGPAQFGAGIAWALR
jgi:hypothetical protein